MIKEQPRKGKGRVLLLAVEEWRGKWHASLIQLLIDLFRDLLNRLEDSSIKDWRCRQARSPEEIYVPHTEIYDEDWTKAESIDLQFELIQGLSAPERKAKARGETVIEISFESMNQLYSEATSGERWGTQFYQSLTWWSAYWALKTLTALGE